MNYNLKNICDGCGLEKKVRLCTGIDPRHYKLNNYLCIKCDNSYHTIPKIIKKNTQFHGLGDPFRLKEDTSDVVIIGEKSKF